MTASFYLSHMKVERESGCVRPIRLARISQSLLSGHKLWTTTTAAEDLCSWLGCGSCECATQTNKQSEFRIIAMVTVSTGSRAGKIVEEM